MKKCTSTIAALAALVAAEPVIAGFDAARFDALIESGMRDWRVPGLSVAAIEDGELVYLRGFGRTGPGGTAVDEHTLFANASTTKAMVAAGLLVLADDGRLSLDDPVIDYLPELHFEREIHTDAVTIRDLLAHRTGLDRTDFWTFRQRMPLAEQIRKLRLVEPAAGPRERLLYQNTMYELAGLVITRVAGKPWYEFLDERLWTPIGMHDTVGMRGRIPEARARVRGHDEVDGEVVPIPYDLEPEQEDAAGSAWSSARDMALWAAFLLADGVTANGERLISEDGIREMFTPAQLAGPDDFYPTVELTEPNWLSYGLGWFQQDFRGRKIDFHTGSLDGLVAIIGLDRAAKMLKVAQRETAAFQERLTLIQADAIALPFADNSLPVVTCLEALEFLPEPETGLAELIRVLRSSSQDQPYNGWLLTSNRVGWEAHLMPGKTWSRAQLLEILSQFPLQYIEVRRWQEIYDLVWAQKVSGN